MKKVIWLGTSKSDWVGFPESVQDEGGYQLDRIQRGEEARRRAVGNR